MAVLEGAALDDARTIMARYPTGRERSAVTLPSTDCTRWSIGSKADRACG